MSVKKQVSQSGQTDPYLNGGTIPLINHDETDVQWFEPMQAKCLLEAPNSSWRYAHIYYREQAAKWEEKLRVLNKERILRHLNHL
jgi:hypothetical protein